MYQYRSAERNLRTSQSIINCNSHLDREVSIVSHARYEFYDWQKDANFPQDLWENLTAQQKEDYIAEFYKDKDIIRQQG